MKISRQQRVESEREIAIEGDCNVHTIVHILAEKTRAYREGMRFVWDPAKERSNRRKHGLWFGDVVPVFEDDFALTVEDPDAEGERRFVTTGCDALGRVVTVVYTFRGSALRVVSARRASGRERESYEGGAGHARKQR